MNSALALLELSSSLCYKSPNGSILARIRILQSHHILGRRFGDAGQLPAKLSSCHTCSSILSSSPLSSPKMILWSRVFQRMRCLVGLFKNTSVAPYGTHRILIEGQLLMVNQTCIKLFLPDLVDGCQQLGFLGRSGRWRVRRARRRSLPARAPQRLRR